MKAKFAVILCWSASIRFNPFPTRVRIMLLLAVLLQGTAWAQQLPRQVISCAGANSAGTNISLSWTLGQPCSMATPPPASFFITQGYQQGDELWVSINGNSSPYAKVKVYPNPSTGKFTLEGVLPAPGVCRYLVIDVSGKQMLSGSFETDAAGSLEATVDMSRSPSGIYYLSLSGGEGTHVYTLFCKLSLIK